MKLSMEEVQKLKECVVADLADERYEGKKNFFNGVLRCVETIEAQQQELESLKLWVNDLQSGMYVNCVYCGHRYGLEGITPVSMADILKEHVKQCPKHPMSEFRRLLVDGIPFVKGFITTTNGFKSAEDWIIEAEKAIRI